MSTERDELRGTLSNTICNASFYAKRAQPYLLGSDMSVVLDKTADALLAAGYSKPFHLSPGLYRNSLGAEIEVISLEMARHILGPVWNAYQNDSLFPRHLIVTPEGMRDAGYERVGDAL